MDRAQKLGRCPLPHESPAPCRPVLQGLHFPCSWRRCSERLATRPHAEGPGTWHLATKATAPATCSNQQPLDSSRIQGQPSPCIWRREGNGAEEEKEAAEQLSAHARRQRGVPDALRFFEVP